MDIVERELTLLFRVSKERDRGDIEHNLRLRADGSIRMRGHAERHDWNVYRDVLVRHDDEIVNVLEQKFGDRLREYNEKILRSKNPGRVIDMQEWYRRQRVSKKTGAMKRGYEECIIQFGDKFAGAPFVYVTDDKGNPLDKDGNVIERWETNKKLVYVLDKNGKPIKSARYEFHKKALIAAYEKIKSENPELVMLGFEIHADEDGGMHAHFDFLVPHSQKRGIGVGLAKSSCMQEICKRKGIKFKNSQEDNAAKAWTEFMREKVIAESMQTWGMKRIDGGAAGREHEDIPTFKMKSEYRCRKIAKEIEAENKRIAARKAELVKKESSFLKKESDLAKRENIIAAKEKSVTEREKSLHAAEDSLNTISTELNTKSAEVNRKTAEIERRERDLREREAVIHNRECAASMKEKSNAAIDGFLKNEKVALESAKTEFKPRMDALVKKEDALRKREAELKKKEKEADDLYWNAVKRENDVNERVASLNYILEMVKKHHPDWLRNAKNLNM